MNMIVQDEASLSENDAFGSGGVVYGGTNSSITILAKDKAKFAGNKAGGSGGVAYFTGCRSASWSMGSNTVASENVALSGALLALSQITLTEPLILTGALTGNSASGGPGGLLWAESCDFQDVVLGASTPDGVAPEAVSCLISNNTASSEGGLVLLKSCHVNSLLIGRHSGAAFVYVRVGVGLAGAHTRISMSLVILGDPWCPW